MTSESNWFSCHQSFDEEFNFLPFFVNSEGYRYALETHEGDIIQSESEGLKYYEEHGLPYVKLGGPIRQGEHCANGPTRPNTESMEGGSSTINIEPGKIRRIK